MRDTARDEFYAGYLPLPAGHRRFLRRVVPVVLWAMVVVSAIIIWRARHPGAAVWDTGTEQTWRGVIHMRPYPWLEITDPPDGTPGAVPIVRAAKIGSQSRVEGLASRPVSVRGFPLEREGRVMIELSDDVTAIQADGGPGLTARAPIVQPLGDVTVRGEIVDYKCYLGAMKPGDGKTHQACARLCISGGIPAAIVFDDAGEPRHYLLAAPDGSSAATLVDPFVGIPVTVSGALERHPGGLMVLRLEPSSLGRR